MIQAKENYDTYHLLMTQKLINTFASQQTLFNYIHDNKAVTAENLMDVYTGELRIITTLNNLGQQMMPNQTDTFYDSVKLELFTKQSAFLRCWILGI